MNTFGKELIFLAQQQRFENFVQKNNIFEICRNLDHLTWQIKCIENELGQIKTVMEEFHECL